MATQFRIDPRIRAYGKARIDITRRARDEQEWQAQWREPRFPFPFAWGSGWKHCVQYSVEDFAAEIGFYIDLLGFPVNAFSPSYAQFTSPAGEFFFGVVAAADGEPATPPESLRLQFMVADLEGTIQELETRGLAFDRKPETGESFPAIAAFHSPHGIVLELWGRSEPIQPGASLQPAVESDLNSSQADFWSGDLVEDGGSDGETGERQPDPFDSEDLDETEDLIDEPVYIDEEDEGQIAPLTPIAASPQDPGRDLKPEFPHPIIRRAEDLVNGALKTPARKGKGNGMRGFPTVGGPGE